MQKRGLTGEIGSSMNLLGNMFNIDGPTLYMTWLFHDKDKTGRRHHPGRARRAGRRACRPRRSTRTRCERARVKMRSALYDEIEGFFGFGRADLLASFALFDDDPQPHQHASKSEFANVTPELIQKTAQEYLRPTNRTMLMVVPKG